MELSEPEDYGLPRVDWTCERCGSVCESCVVPSFDFCEEGHRAVWSQPDEHIESNIDLLESLGAMDEIVVWGKPGKILRGKVTTTSSTRMVCDSIGEAGRIIRWDRSNLTIEWKRIGNTRSTYHDVYYVERL